MRVAVDVNNPGSFAIRITSLSGINGSTLGAAGGDQLMQLHNHASPALTDPGHNHSLPGGPALGGNPSGSGWLTTPGPNTGTATTGITLAANVGTTGSGGSQNMPPTIVSFLALIKT